MAREFRIVLRCCLLVLLCATHGSLAVDPPAGQASLSENEWNNLIHNVVHLLYPQRGSWDRRQFGFIVVGNLGKVAASKELALERKLSLGGNSHNVQVSALTVGNAGQGSGQPWVDNWSYSPSNRNMYINYVTARPYTIADRDDPRRYKEHTEEFLLGELQILYSQYNMAKGVPPDFVLLYTWFPPCNCCLNDIVKQRKEPGTKHLTWIVAYSRNLTPGPPQGTLPQSNVPTYTVSIAACKDQFASNNIKFMQVNCGHYPPNY